MIEKNKISNEYPFSFKGSKLVVSFRSIYSLAFYLLCISFPLTDFLNAFYQGFFSGVQAGDFTPGLIIRGGIFALFCFFLVKQILENKFTRIQFFLLLGLFFFGAIWLLQVLLLTGYEFVNMYDLSKLLFPYAIFIVIVNWRRYNVVRCRELFAGIEYAGWLYNFNVIGSFLLEYGSRSYSGSSSGYMGLIIAKNSFSLLLILFLCYGIHQLIISQNYLRNCCFVIITIISMLIVQTRASLLGIIAVPVLYGIFWLIYRLELKRLILRIPKYRFLFIILLGCFALITFGIYLNYVPASRTITKLTNMVKFRIFFERETFTLVKLRNQLRLRGPLIRAAQKVWYNYNNLQKAIGAGKVRAESLVAWQLPSWAGEREGVEVGHFDLVLKYGLIGSIIYLFLVLSILFKGLNNYIFKKANTSILLITVSTLLFAHSILAGHLLWTPWLTFFWVLICSVSFNSSDVSKLRCNG